MRVLWETCAANSVRPIPYTLVMAARTRRIEIRVTEDERALEEAAASAQGETLSEFVRGAARRQAEQVLAERTSYVVDDNAAARFLAALEAPGEDAERGLLRLLKQPSVLRSE
jgi:uncharacterized protein (DUF1778 family)